MMMTGKVFIMFERDEPARNVRVFANEKDAEDAKRVIEESEELDNVRPFMRSIMIIQETEVE